MLLGIYPLLAGSVNRDSLLRRNKGKAAHGKNLPDAWNGGRRRMFRKCYGSECAEKVFRSFLVGDQAVDQPAPDGAGNGREFALALGCGDYERTVA